MNNNIHKEANWELHINYRQKGSRSEGQHGHLFHNGRLLPSRPHPLSYQPTCHFLPAQQSY
ncbi:MAG: hypothetical protein GY805_06130 [Chloroflexi bacterium]|nr:hypothetical protein [Chloroflexota bacterium]